MLDALESVAEERGIPLDVHADAHFLCSHRTFDDWAEGRKSPTMEYFYRMMRREYDVLLTGDGDPVGGDWNFDKQNRERFGADGPGLMPEPIQFETDGTTQGALDDVAAHFPDAYGSLDAFNWPVTPDQAEAALDDFIEHRLPTFGTYQDAMWTDRPFLYHSRLSAALNLKLLDPRRAIARAEAAYHDGHAPINAVEGFIRQILGWREFVRGLYWRHMPDYADLNALDATADLPDFFWTGDTEMTCVRQCIDQLLEHAYAHHIQRLMVLGLFGMLYGADPQQMNAWHEALYADAWEWVSMPNMIGMSQYADGGIVGTKPYAASGKYINRMSNYCSHCRYDPDKATGDDACPFTTLYWDFLARHREQFSGNRRMNFQLANLRRKGDDAVAAIRDHAETIRDRAANGSL
jgi:deoxyribodipyrimidine photolyase-related protein